MVLLLLIVLILALLNGVELTFFHTCSALDTFGRVDFIRLFYLSADNSGSLGCAISEAVERAVTSDGYKYVLGSVLNQVVLHQSIIGLESKLAMEMLDEYPDIVIGCAAGS